MWLDILFTFYYSPKGHKLKDHQNSASMHGMNHCRLQHVHADSFSPHWNQKGQNNLRHLTSQNSQDIPQTI